jgi:glutathione peroxidase-family protein
MESGSYSAAFSGFATKTLEGEESTMGQIVAGKKAVLIVNVASE